MKASEVAPHVLAFCQAERQFHPFALLWSLIFLLTLIAVFITASAPAIAGDAPDWAADELVVVVRPGTLHAKARAIYHANGAVLLDRIPQINAHRIRVPAHALENVQRALSHRPEVQYVEKNYRLSLEAFPNDPGFQDQWHLPQIDAPQAWDITRGVEGLIIAILDTGVDPDHPDLESKLVAGYNFYDGNTDTADVHGHGTAVAGAAAAVTDNDLGVAGVAWYPRIMPVRIASPQGYAYIWTIAQALVWAVDNGARVMNISFSGIAGSVFIQDAAIYVRSQGGLVVAAAGNCGCFDYTAENPYIVSVSATDPNDLIASFSSRGIYVDLAAPGVSILTTWNGGTYGSASGTSFSSPITAGVAALIMSVNPDLTPAEVEDILLATADDLGPLGYDTSYGYGRVNAYQAVLTASGSSPPPDTTPPAAEITDPAHMQTVAGTLTVTVDASDDRGVEMAALYIDGVRFADDLVAPYEFVWDTTAYANGQHTLTAKAYDAVGNEGLDEITVFVDNASGDTTPPAIQILSPPDGDVSKVVRVLVEAVDDTRVDQVALYIDGSLYRSVACDGPACTIKFNWNTRRESKGPHTLQAVAFDAAGNRGESEPVNVNVK